MMRFTYILLISFLLSCGSSSSQDKSPQGPQEKDPKGHQDHASSKPLPSQDSNKEITLPLSKEAKEVVDTLYGEWKSECIVFTYQGTEDSMFSQLTLQENGIIKITIHHFRDEECTRTHWQDTEIVARVKEGGEVSEPQGARAVDYTLESIILTPIDVRNTLGMKRAGFCGESVWKRNEPYDLTGKTCNYIIRDQAQTIKFPAQGDVKKDIFKVEDGILRFGLELNQIEKGLSPERPKSFNELRYHRIK